MRSLAPVPLAFLSGLLSASVLAGPIPRQVSSNPQQHNNRGSDFEPSEPGKISSYRENVPTGLEKRTFGVSPSPDGRVSITNGRGGSIIIGPEGVFMSNGRGGSIVSGPEGVSMSNGRGGSIISGPKGVSMSNGRGGSIVSGPEGVSVSNGRGGVSINVVNSRKEVHVDKPATPRDRAPAGHRVKVVKVNKPAPAPARMADPRPASTSPPEYVPRYSPEADWSRQPDLIPPPMHPSNEYEVPPTRPPFDSHNIAPSVAPFEFYYGKPRPTPDLRPAPRPEYHVSTPDPYSAAPSSPESEERKAFYSRVPPPLEHPAPSQDWYSVEPSAPPLDSAPPPDGYSVEPSIAVLSSGMRDVGDNGRLGLLALLPVKSRDAKGEDRS